MAKINIAFLGDIMPGGVISGVEDGYISDELINYLSRFDLIIANLEAPLGEGYEFDEKKMNLDKGANIVFAKNEDIKKLKKLNVNVVTLSNNHIFDLGEKGFLNTLKILDENDIGYFGAGRNSIEASRVFVKKINNKNIGFIGYMPPEWMAPHFPADNEPGINYLYLNKIDKQIKEAKKEVDYLFVFMHWGDEHTYVPSKANYNIAKQMIDMGVDGIIGAHSHRVQPYISYKSNPIFFSLGNFLFPDRIITNPRVTYYPENDTEINQMPVTYAYPFVEEPTLKIWPSKARIGMIGEVFISKEIRFNGVLTVLNSENKIQKYNNYIKLKVLLFSLGIFIKYTTKLFYFSYKLQSYIRRKIGLK